MKKIFFIILVWTIFLTACKAPQKYLIAQDGIRIAYDYYEPDLDNSPGAVLIHMLPANRASWRDFALELRDRGFGVIAIDFRGRGESEGKLQKPEDFMAIELDVKAAIDFIKKQPKINGKKIILIGASIGANHALRLAAKTEEVVAAILLSPGLDYRGVKTENAAKEFDKPLLVIAAEGDEYAFRSSARIYDLAKGVKEFKTLAGAAHGTNMLTTELNLFIFDWIKKAID